MASIHVEEPINEEQNSPETTMATQVPQNTDQNHSIAPTNSKIKQFITDPSKRALLIVAVLVVAFGGYIVKSNNDKQQLQQQIAAQQQAPEKANDDEALRLKAAISEFMELPADETPTVATVVDAEKVREQSFFRNAANDDKVLLFATAGKAILYRPSTNKVIEVAPINLGQEQADSTTEESTQQ